MAYLFAHFIGEEKDGEQVYFAVSRDGLHFQDLNGGRPVLYSGIGTCGVRDPFLVRNPENGKVYLIATDLKIESGCGWHMAQEAGSLDIIVWETKDLVHWSKERSCTVGLPNAGCVWAPEAVFDKEKKAFFVFFASKVKNREEKGKHRIYATYTKDFKEFSEPFLYMEKECDVIDSTILESNGRYFRISKDETDKRLLLEVSDTLLGEYTPIAAPTLKALEGVEGPEGYLLPDQKTWCLLADQFAASKGYLPMVTQDLASGDFRILDADQYHLGKTKKRHGGIMQITEEEYERLSRYYSQPVELKISREKGPDIPKEFIGLFIEDINYAVDGGLYAELLENRNFESVEVFGGKDKDYFVKSDRLYAWDSYPDTAHVQLSVVQGSPVHENNPHYLRVEAEQGNVGFSNKAYDGIYMRPALAYRISFYARNVDYQGKLRIAVIGKDRVLCETSVDTKAADAFGWHKWEKYEAVLRTEEEVRGARFVIRMENAGTMEFDFFSMIPEDAVYGIFRKDIAEMLKELHPGFLRFPGGCVVEGATLANRYQFKKTLGSMEERHFNWNRWALHGNSEENGYHSRYAHYGQTCGIGFYEYFLLCEYLGAKPLPVLGVGMACQFQSHEKIEPEDSRIKEYIQDYLDLIEFANGDADTGWGTVRVCMGHEKPFGLEMIGVGNEQWENEESRFFERYTLFEREIHKVYPKIKLIGTAGPELDSERFKAAWDFYRRYEEKEGFVYAVDEHYYTKPDWFIRHTDYFDKVPRKTKIFFGEYAAHPMGWMPMNASGGNNLEGALAEAAFLTGMLRNSDVVVMTCYAPLLARIGYTQWNPDLIWFDEKEAYRTPNYYVQQMFAQNLGDYNIRVEETKIPCQVSFDKKEKELIIKLVNTSSHEQEFCIAFEDGKIPVNQEITEIILTGKQLTDSNAIGREDVKPKKHNIVIDNGRYKMPPFSFCVLRFPAK